MFNVIMFGLPLIILNDLGQKIFFTKNIYRKKLPYVLAYFL